MKKDDYRVPKSTCPDCGAEHGAAYGPDSGGEKPKPGDISICVKCQAILIFGDKLMLRPPTEAEIAEIPLDLISRYQKALTTVKKC
jgi:hypothetical protein